MNRLTTRRGMSHCTGTVGRRNFIAIGSRSPLFRSFMVMLDADVQVRRAVVYEMMKVSKYER